MATQTLSTAARPQSGLCSPKVSFSWPPRETVARQQGHMFSVPHSRSGAARAAPSARLGARGSPQARSAPTPLLQSHSRRSELSQRRPIPRVAWGRWSAWSSHPSIHQEAHREYIAEGPGEPATRHLVHDPAGEPYPPLEPDHDADVPRSHHLSADGTNGRHAARDERQDERSNVSQVAGVAYPGRGVGPRAGKPTTPGGRRMELPRVPAASFACGVGSAVARSA